MIPIIVLPPPPRKQTTAPSILTSLVPKDASLTSTDFTHCPTPIRGHQSHTVASVWTHDREGRRLCFKAHPVPDENFVCNKTWPPHIPDKYPGACTKFCNTLLAFVFDGPFVQIFIFCTWENTFWPCLSFSSKPQRVLLYKPLAHLIHACSQMVGLCSHRGFVWNFHTSVKDSHSNARGSCEIYD